MERTDFLKRCQLYSAMQYKNVPESVFVWYNGVKYLPYAYEMNFDKGNVINNAILKDTRANMVIKVNVERVKENREEE